MAVVAPFADCRVGKAPSPPLLAIVMIRHNAEVTKTEDNQAERQIRTASQILADRARVFFKTWRLPSALV